MNAWIGDNGPTVRRHAGLAGFAMVILSPCILAEQQPFEDFDPTSVLSRQQWQQLDRSVDRALSWLAAQQQRDGSFRGPNNGQPAITSFAVLAFLSRGHLPGEGPYGVQLSRAVDYILSCQRRDGLFTRIAVLGKIHIAYRASHTCVYNHAITSLVVSELHGMVGRDHGARMASAIDRALHITWKLQDRPKPAIDEGAWRYWHGPDRYTAGVSPAEADLSVTSWQLMFLRSAKNAGFDVPSERIDRAMRFVLSCFDKDQNVFRYHPEKKDACRPMTSAGLLCLSLSGMFDTDIARRTGDWLLAHPYDRYLAGPDKGRFHYGLFYAVPGMYHLGGSYWERFFPTTVNTLLRHQGPRGNWRPEQNFEELRLGDVYTTSLVVTALNTPNQLLPIFQR